MFVRLWYYAKQQKPEKLKNKDPWENTSQNKTKKKRKTGKKNKKIRKEMTYKKETKTESRLNIFSIFLFCYILWYVPYYNKSYVTSSSIHKIMYLWCMYLLYVLCAEHVKQYIKFILYFISFLIFYFNFVPVSILSLISNFRCRFISWKRIYGEMGWIG